MDKKVAGIIGAVSALAMTQAKTGSTQPPVSPASLAVSSYADLLNPIPDALTVLATTQLPDLAAPEVQTVGYRDNRRDHHRNTVGRILGSLLGVPMYHHHHHHHHHHGYGYYGSRGY